MCTCIAYVTSAETCIAGAVPRVAEVAIDYACVWVQLPRWRGGGDRLCMCMGAAAEMARMWR